MTRVALLVQKTAAIEDGNYLRFARALHQRQYQVDVCSIDSLRMIDSQIVADGFPWQPSLDVDSLFPEQTTQVIEHDIVWILSLGDRGGFLDKYQLLYALPDHIHIVNSLDAIMHLKSKFFLASRPELFPGPKTFASPNAEELIGIIREQGGQWIVKPPAGSLGRDVFKVNAEDKNLNAIVQHLCGVENSNYIMLQRYIPEIESGEKRVLIAGGKVIDQYRRFAHNDHRTNLSQGALIEHCSLNDDERQLCNHLGKELLKFGALFVGVDLAFPAVIEINVINPGGIVTIDELTSVDQSEAVVNALLKAI